MGVHPREPEREDLLSLIVFDLSPHVDESGTGVDARKQLVGVDPEHPADLLRDEERLGQLVRFDENAFRFNRHSNRVAVAIKDVASLGKQHLFRSALTYSFGRQCRSFDDLDLVEADAHRDPRTNEPESQQSKAQMGQLRICGQPGGRP